MEKHLLTHAVVYRLTILVSVMLYASSSIRAADVTSTLVGSGTWTTNGIWNSAMFPNNGNGGLTYDAIVNSGSVDIPALTQIVIESLSFGFGTISGSGGLQLNVSSSWTGNGKFAGPAAGMGQLTLSGVGPLTVSNGCCTKFYSGSVTNAGTLVWQDGATIQNQGTGSTFTNTGLIDHRGDGGSFSDTGGGALINASGGTYRRSVGTGTAAIAMPFTNNGTIEVNTGVLQLTQGGNSSGIVDVAAGASLDFTSGSFAFESGAASTGAGLVRVAGGTVNLNGASSFTNLEVANGTLNVNGTAQVGNLSLPSGGVVNGVGSLTLSGASTWTGGSLTGPTAGMGQLTLSGTGPLTVSGFGAFKNFQGAVKNAGTLVWQSAASIRGVSTGSTFTNTGLIDIQGSGTAFTQTASSTLINSVGGTLRRSVDTGTATIALPLTNNGTIDARSGTLNISGGLSNIDAPTATLSGGAYRAIDSGSGGTLQVQDVPAITTVAAGTTLELSGANPVMQFGTTSLTTSLVNNAGTLQIRNGHTFTPTQSLNNTGTIELGATGLAGATLNSSSDITNAPNGEIVGHGQIDGAVVNQGSVSGNSVTEFLEINGTVSGAGSMENVRIDGTHITSLAGTTAIVPLEGSYRLLDNVSHLAMDLGGLTPGTQHDQLSSIGNVVLAGNLDVSYVDLGISYTPSPGDRFTIITSISPITGTFDVVNLPFAGGRAAITWLPVDYSNPNEVTLEIAAIDPFSADNDNDGDVDGRDFLIWQRGGSPNPFSVRDLVEWQAEYGNVGGPVNISVAVPEPSAVILLVGCLALWHRK